MENASKILSDNNHCATRAQRLKKHTYLTFVFKLLSVALSYLLLSLTVKYLDIEQYGIWVTLLSIMSWISFFDIGLGNGLRNKLAEAIAVGDINRIREYISTAYVAVASIAMVLLLMFLALQRQIDWCNIFNTVSIDNNDLSNLLSLTAFFFALNFVLSISNQIFYAHQEASLVALSQAILNGIAVALVYLLIHFFSANLFYLGLCYGLSMIIASTMMILFFFNKYRSIVPLLSYVDVSKIYEIGTLGFKFFVIQISALIIFATDNVIITQVLGPAEVTSYNIVMKLFSIVTVGFSIVSAPMWSAYTDAYTKKDFYFLKKMLIRLNFLVIIVSCFVFLLVLNARFFIKIWIGAEIDCSDNLIFLMGIYSIVFVWNAIYSTFLNGTGYLNLSLIISFLAAILNIPLSIYFSKDLQLGNAGIILGTIVSLSPGIFLGPFQTLYILYSRKKTGVLHAIFS